MTSENCTIMKAINLSPVDGKFTIENIDEQLIERVLSGEIDAFEELFNRYKRIVAGIASGYFGDPSQVEEVIQISFAKAYLELNGFRGEHHYSFAKWLGQITRNTCLDILRRKKRKAENLFCELPPERIERLFGDIQAQQKTLENLIIERDLAHKLLLSLPNEDRLILQMLFEEGMNFSQIADVLKCTNIKVRVRVHRAKKELRKILNGTVANK